MKKIPILIISGLIVLLILTNPSKKDFDSYISTHINEYAIQTGEDDQTANLISGFSYLLLQTNPSIIQTTNYLLFTIYKLDTSLIRSFGGDVEDLVIMGLFNNFIIVNQF